MNFQFRAANEVSKSILYKLRSSGSRPDQREGQITSRMEAEQVLNASSAFGERDERSENYIMK